MKFKITLLIITLFFFSHCKPASKGGVSPVALALLGSNSANTSACSEDTESRTSTNRTVSVTWSANKEKDVNKLGGGYKVCYSKTCNFNIATASCQTVDYVSGPTAPTSTTINITSTGTWYIKVIGFSAINSTGGDESSEFSLKVN